MRASYHTSQSIMGVVQRVHNDMTVAPCTERMYTLPEIEQILTSLISPPTPVTFSPLQSLVKTNHVLVTVMKKHLCTAQKQLQRASGYFNSVSKSGALFTFYSCSLPSQHLTLNSNESSHFSSLTMSGRQLCGTMWEVNQIPVMVLTSA